MKHGRLYLFLIVALATLVTITATLGRYTFSGDSELGAIKGADFVFVTDLVPNSEGTPYYVSDGSIDFTVKNFDGVNKSDGSFAIDFTVTSFPSATGVGNYSISGDSASKSISLTGLTEGDYKVVINSTAPYSETIELYFVVQSSISGAYYTVTEHTYWTQVDLYTGIDASSISLTYTGAPDNANSIMATWGSNTKSSFTPQPYTHYKLIFFNLTALTITQSGNTVPMK